MPAVFLLIRSVLLRILGSRLAGTAAHFLSRSVSTAAAHLSAALRLVWERISSQESKEAILGCVLCILNMHKKRGRYNFAKHVRNHCEEIQQFIITLSRSYRSIRRIRIARTLPNTWFCTWDRLLKDSSECMWTEGLKLSIIDGPESRQATLNRLSPYSQQSQQHSSHHTSVQSRRGFP